MNKKTIAIAMATGALTLTGLATEHTFNWTKAFPDTGDDIVYKDSSGTTRAKFQFAWGNTDKDNKGTEYKWLINRLDLYPSEGDTIRFTGEPMMFFMTNAQAYVYSHAKDTTVVFDNIVTNRTTYWCKEDFSDVAITWQENNGNTFIGTEWKRIATGVSLADYEPVAVGQQSITVTSGKWFNPYWAYVQQLVRSKDKLTFQYRTSTLQPSKQPYYVVVIKLELKQGDDGIYARALPKTYKVWTVSGDTVTYGTGGNSKQFDVDEMEVNEKMTVHDLFVNDGTAKQGGGINTIKLQRIKPVVTYRFTNKCRFTASLTPFREAVQCEFTQPQNCSFKHQTPNLATSSVRYRDFDGTHHIPSYNNGAGRAIYETTVAAKTNYVTITSGSTYNSAPMSGQYIVRGNPDSGSRMVVTLKNREIFGSNNNFFRVERGGELILTNSTPNASQTNVLLACDGGIIRQLVLRPFQSSGSQRIVLDGGMLEFRNLAGTNLEGNFHNLTLKNGARVFYTKVASASSIRGALFCNHGGEGKIAVAGSLPSTNDAPLCLMSTVYTVDKVNYGIPATNTFLVSSTGQTDGSADFVQNADISRYYGSSPFQQCFFRKAGDGTMLMNGNLATLAANPVILAAGTLKFGKKANGSSYTCALPIALEGGTLAAVDGASMNFGAIERLTANSAITVGANATFTFSASNAKAGNWVSGKTLNITLPSSSQIRFGTAKSALTDAQLKQIRINGHRVVITDSGYLKELGLMLLVR